jgi:hypothetical protein
MIKIIISIIIVGVFCYSICAVPKSKYEQRLEDEAQMQYLKEYRNKRSMVKH